MPPDASPGKSNTFRELAEAQRHPRAAAGQDARSRGVRGLQDVRADLNVMAFVTDIVPLSILNHPPAGHHPVSPVAAARATAAPAPSTGRSSTARRRPASPSSGPTRAWTPGPILLQKEVAIEPDDTLGTVYFGKLFPLGVEALLESVRLVKEGKAPKIAQDLTQGEYEPVCKDMTIDWMYPVGVVYNVIRGCNPSPGAATTFEGQQLKIFDCEKRAESGPQAPGTVTQITDDGFLVAGQRRQHLREAGAAAGAAKLSAAEFASFSGIKAGDVLG